MGASNERLIRVFVIIEVEVDGEAAAALSKASLHDDTLLTLKSREK